MGRNEPGSARSVACTLVSMGHSTVPDTSGGRAFRGGTMDRRLVAWLIVLAALTTMATLRLADRKERVTREPSNVTRNEPARPESTSSAVGGCP